MSTIVGNMSVGGPATILWLGPANYSGHSKSIYYRRAAAPYSAKHGRLWRGVCPRERHSRGPAAALGREPRLSYCSGHEPRLSLFSIIFFS